MKAPKLAAVYIIMGGLLSLSPLSAFTTDDAIHPVAHGGGSYALTHMGYVACKQLTSLKDGPCKLIAASAALSIGIAVEASQSQTKANAMKGLGYDAIGIGVCLGILSF